MPTLDSLLVLFGAIDQAVVENHNPEIDATVERLLPGTTGRHAGWYKQIEAFISVLKDQARRAAEAQPGEVLVPEAAIAPVRTLDEALAHFSRTPDTSSPQLSPEDQIRTDQPSVPERARAMYAASVLARIGKITPDQLAAVLAAAGTAGQNAFADTGTLPESQFLDQFTERTQFVQFMAMAQTKNLIDVDIASVPGPPRGLLKRFGDDYCTVLETEYVSGTVDLDAVKKVVDPQNWPGCCKYWNSVELLTPDAAHLNPQGWTRMLENVAPFGLGITTALKYRKAEVGNGIVINFDLDDDRNNTADDGRVLVDNGYIWATPEGAGVRIRTSKEARVQALGATALAMWAYALGWSQVGESLILGCAASPPNTAVGWEPSPPTTEEGPSTPLLASGQTQLPRLSAADREQLIGTSVEVITTALNAATASAASAGQRWLDGQLGVEDIQALTADLGARATVTQSDLRQAGTQLLPDPDTPA